MPGYIPIARYTNWSRSGCFGFSRYSGCCTGDELKSNIFTVTSEEARLRFYPVRESNSYILMSIPPWRNVKSCSPIRVAFIFLLLSFSLFKYFKTHTYGYVRCITEILVRSKRCSSRDIDPHVFHAWKKHQDTLRYIFEK